MQRGTAQGSPLRRGQARRCGRASPRRGRRWGASARARAPCTELPARPWERDERETTNQRESVTEWRCGRPAAPRGATRMLAARSSPGRWRRWRQATENYEVAHRREPSERHGWRGRPGAQREHGKCPPWRRRSDELMEGKLRHTPTRRAKCRMWGSGKPLRFELWGAREVFP